MRINALLKYTQVSSIRRTLKYKSTGTEADQKYIKGFKTEAGCEYNYNFDDCGRCYAEAVKILRHNISLQDCFSVHARDMLKAGIDLLGKNIHSMGKKANQDGNNRREVNFLPFHCALGRAMHIKNTIF